ncbi:XRE family transcriptional regulator [Desulfosporosinus fructosivorans]|uniref:XRE family transcriptional regulator n=2 Tax=Desulfosporosinus fructosivorans TaxID=2018669 RepID=A0A4Z0R345_9FIRM|nr:XRE family transcriptional regulator [Desulfosporosinus fructosivorans]
MMRMNRLELIMHKKNMTQNDLSKLTGISQNDISKIINDRKDIYLTTAQKIARAVGEKVDYIWYDY